MKKREKFRMDFGAQCLKDVKSLGYCWKLYVRKRNIRH